MQPAALVVFAALDLLLFFLLHGFCFCWTLHPLKLHHHHSPGNLDILFKPLTSKEMTLSPSKDNASEQVLTSCRVFFPAFTFHVVQKKPQTKKLVKNIAILYSHGASPPLQYSCCGILESILAIDHVDTVQWKNIVSFLYTSQTKFYCNKARILCPIHFFSS